MHQSTDGALSPSCERHLLSSRPLKSVHKCLGLTVLLFLAFSQITPQNPHQAKQALHSVCVCIKIYTLQFRRELKINLFSYDIILS